MGTGGATGAMAPHFSAKIILKFFPFFLKRNLYTENDSPGRGGHKSAQKYFLEVFVFARDEMEVSLTPSLLVTRSYALGSVRFDLMLGMT